MNKLKLKILCLAMFFVGTAAAVHAQKQVKDFLTHKVMVSHADHTIIAYVKPTGQVTLDTDKRYYWFSGNQINNTQGGFSGKLLNGDYQEFYRNKGLKESGKLDKGLKTGVWKSWDEQGKLIDDYTWSAGQKNGVYHKYDSVGKVMEAGKYKKDLLNGKQQMYMVDGQQDVWYKNGKVTERKKVKMPHFVRKIFSKNPKSL